MINSPRGYKEIPLSIDMDISEASIEQAFILLQLETQDRYRFTILEVSVFDVKLAIDLLIGINLPITRVNRIIVTPEFSEGEWKLVDQPNKLFIKSGA